MTGVATAAQGASGTPMDRMLDHGAYMWERNRRRLLVLLVVLTAAVILFGVSGIIAGIVGLITGAPGMVVLLLFYAFAMIAQFGALMLFLSRPRKYVVTPDSPQIGLSFHSYRGQPDLLEHAKSTVKILQGIPKFRAMGGEPPRGMLLSGAPGTGKSYLAAIIAAQFLYLLFGLILLLSAALQVLRLPGVGGGLVPIAGFASLIGLEYLASGSADVPAAATTLPR